MTSLPPFSGVVDLAALAAKSPQGQQAGSANGPQAMTEANAGEYLQESTRRPVYVLLCSAAAPQCEELRGRVVALLGRYGESVTLVTVDIDTEPGLAEAFQLQAVPAMLALLAGRPVPLFQGTPDDAQLADVFEQVAQVAREAGMDVRDSGPVADQTVDGEAEEAPLPPLHQEAFDAIERGDYEAAVAAYEQALKENPKDADARAGKAQVSLIARSGTADAEAVRKAAADSPDDLDAQLAVADLDVLGGMIEDAFDRLIDAVSVTAGPDRERVRARLIELFDVVGPTDPRVSAARQRLASALY
ncbi:tetratricopeptide repeat protein [Demequina sp. TTPB684]|uniref:co-chaperone YbbN n=1 Tax=unclassified Demequina TaxID=2620311 RepID=UPI001CF21699|nr:MULTISPECIES: tetratricopeptide repeat protein [unclassified Demequina]MCB2413990.1 tetratricopeptide repeat protein [Demequina sp. TTPB684]UPU88658.1 tetratricopeptide repeat protein [Demequina sp. TMPB413]